MSGEHIITAIEKEILMKFKKTVSIVLCVSLIWLFAVSSFAANSVSAPAEWYSNSETVFAETGRICLAPGAEHGDMNFAWVVTGLTHVNEKFIYGKQSDLSDGIAADVTTITTSSFVSVSNRVSLVDLEAGAYYYNYTYNGEWQEISSFTIQNIDDGFSVMLCSDPQLGRSGDDTDNAIIDDCYGWNRTLEAAKAKCPEMSFALCAGDQVNVAINKKEYNAFLYPQALRSVPLATAVGNHDFYSPMYTLAFNNPNVSSEDFLSTAGNGYYFGYGNALFIVINSNNYIIEDHRAVIASAVNAYPDAKWRVVMMHTSPYFSGMKEDDQTTVDLYCPVFDEFDIDMVLSGHEHIYSRTAPMTADCLDENGVTYLAVSTASGCSYDSYENVDGRIVFNKNCAEPTYSILDFSENEINVKSYTTDSDERFDEFSIEKENASSVEVNYTFTEWYVHIIKMIFTLIGLLFK